VWRFNAVQVDEALIDDAGNCIEKEKQIDQIKTKIEQITKEQIEIRKREEKQQQIKQTRKAVRIQEPDAKDDQNNEHLNVINIDPISDSGFVSNRNSRPSDFEFSESYL